jgi:hypothetical protein
MHCVRGKKRRQVGLCGIYVGKAWIRGGLFRFISNNTRTIPAVSTISVAK